MILAVIVEDDPMVMEINRQYMKKIPGINVISCCRNGAEALDYLRNKKADLILMDMFMPEMTGLELLRALRSEGNQADVIMVTADNSIRDIKDAMSLGIIDYLIKPFEFERFKAAVEKAVVKRNLTEKEMSGVSSLTQEEIDQLLQGDPGPNLRTQSNLDKGIQASTLELFLQCLSSAKDESMDCEALAKASNLSKVTVRRYMNYLIENDRAESIIDYSTGGRPAIRYSIKK